MDLEFFPHFIRINFPNINLTNEEAIEIGKEFKKYLIDKFKDKSEILEKIWDINLIRVIMDQNNPLKINGYNPALVLHFTQFVETKQKETLISENIFCSSCGERENIQFVDPKGKNWTMDHFKCKKCGNRFVK